jgi:hypothetical protein
VRFGWGMLALLAACAAFAAGACAHVAIDIVGDYALPHDTYDFIPHTSRDFVTALALAVATIIAVRGLRFCCDLSAANRGRLNVRPLSGSQAAFFIAATIAGAAFIVPGMELLDGKLDHVVIDDLGDAFGGSVLLGLGTTVACAAVIATIAFAAVRWLVSHQDSIAVVLHSLIRRSDAAPAVPVRLGRYVPRPQKRRSAPALRRCKRGPPVLAIDNRQLFNCFFQGDPRENTTLARFALAFGLRDRAFFGCARSSRYADTGGTSR